MTPDTWHTNNQKVFQISGTNAGLNIFTRAGSAHLSSNFIYNNGDAGVFQAASGYAMHHAVNATNGTFDWISSSAASSSAGSAATMVTRLRIHSNGYMSLGSTSAPTKFGIRGSSATTDATMQIVGNGVSTLLLGQDARGGVIRGQGGSNELSFRVGGNGDTAAGSGGIEALRINSSGALGLNGANYGSSGQVLTSQGSGSSATWSTVGGKVVNYDSTIVTAAGSASVGQGNYSNNIIGLSYAAAVSYTHLTLPTKA